MNPNPEPVLPADQKNPETEAPHPVKKDDYDPEDFPPGDEADKEGGNAGPEKKRRP